MEIARTSCPSGSETIRRSTTAGVQGINPVCEDARILGGALIQSQHDLLSTTNIISPHHSAFQNDRNDRHTKENTCFCGCEAEPFARCIGGRFEVRFSLRFFYLRFATRAEYNPPVSSKGVPRGHML